MKRKPWWAFMWLLVALILIAAQGQTAATVTAAPVPADEATRVREADGMVMVYVPAGEFLMGSPTGNWEANERPQHTVNLDAFWIDRTEVTNAQYRRCVEAGQCRAPTDCTSGSGEPTYNDTTKSEHPVVCVNWEDART